jgi:hypothetical protein
MEYNGLSSLFAGDRDLTIRLNVQLCVDAPAALPSFSLQCTGADCASFLDTGAQIKNCQVDADCGAGHHCQQLDNSLLGNFIGSTWWGADMDDTCDSGVKNMQAAFNLVKQATNQGAVAFPESETFLGLCSFKAQDALLVDLAPWSATAIVNNNGSIVVGGMAAYQAALVDNSNVTPEPTPTPTPSPAASSTGSAAPTVTFKNATLSLQLQYNRTTVPATLIEDFKAGIKATTGFPSRAGQSLDVTYDFVLVDRVAAARRRLLAAAALAAANQVEVLQLTAVFTPADSADVGAYNVSTAIGKQLACADQACAEAVAAEAGFASSIYSAPELTQVTQAVVPNSVVVDGGATVVPADRAAAPTRAAAWTSSPLSVIAAIVVAIAGVRASGSF